jgi:hypothetical protein
VTPLSIKDRTEHLSSKLQDLFEETACDAHRKSKDLSDDLRGAEVMRGWSEYERRLKEKWIPEAALKIFLPLVLEVPGLEREGRKEKIREWVKEAVICPAGTHTKRCFAVACGGL